MVNDISIAFGIIGLFIFLGVFIPIIENDLAREQLSSADVDGLESQVEQSLLVTTTLTIVDVIVSVISMFFWTFGAIPFWLDSFFLLLRVTLALIIARNVWIGGGG